MAEQHEQHSPRTLPGAAFRSFWTHSPPYPHQTAWLAVKDGESAAGSPHDSPAAGFSPAADGASEAPRPLRQPSLHAWSLVDEHEQLQRASTWQHIPPGRGKGGGDGREANGDTAGGGGYSAGLGAAPVGPFPGGDSEVEVFANSLQVSAAE